MPTTADIHAAPLDVPDEVDVVVVGARAAGAATAMLLARHGLRVLVVDRGRYGTDTMSTHALMRGGVLQLTRWGLIDEIVAAGTPPVRRTTFTYADERVPITVKPSYGVDALYAPRRTVLDPVLVDAADRAGADIRFGVSAIDVTRTVDGAVDGVVVAAGGSSARVAAKVVVGADGLRSRIADRVGARFDRLGAAASAATFGYWTGLDTDGYEWIFRAGAAAGVIPTNDGQACVFICGTPTDVGQGGMAVLRRILARAEPELMDRLDAAEPPASTRTFTGRVGHVRRSWGRGWALVGDAGYWKDPISAHGLTDALRDAELLARAIVDVVADGADERDALRGYQTARDTLSRALFDVTEELASYRWTDVEVPSILLRLNAAMADELEALAALTPLPPPLVSR